MSKKTTASKKETTINGPGKSNVLKTQKQPIVVEGVPAQVTVGRGVTLNVGNYQSERIDIRITMPCEPNDAAIKRTINHLFKEVDVEMTNRIKQVDKELETGLELLS